MTAAAVRATLDAAFLVALAGWVGGLGLLLFGIEPTARHVLGDVPARLLRRALLPIVSTWGVTCGAIALPASLGAPLSYPEFRHYGVLIQAGCLLVGTVAMLSCGAGIAPKLARLKADEGDRIDALLRKVRRRNLLVLVLGTVCLVTFACRPEAKTEGIVEPSPRERARRLYEAAEARSRPSPPAKSLTPPPRPDGSALGDGNGVP